MTYPSYRRSDEYVRDEMNEARIRVVLDDARENLGRYTALLKADAGEQQTEAAIDLCYEHLRAALDPQLLIRAVLILLDEVGKLKGQT